MKEFGHIATSNHPTIQQQLLEDFCVLFAKNDQIEQQNISFNMVHNGIAASLTTTQDSQSSSLQLG
jgi:hypothetical protein